MGAPKGCLCAPPLSLSVDHEVSLAATTHHTHISARSPFSAFPRFVSLCDVMWCCLMCGHSSFEPSSTSSSSGGSAGGSVAWTLVRRSPHEPACCLPGLDVFVFQRGSDAPINWCVWRWRWRWRDAARDASQQQQQHKILLCDFVGLPTLLCGRFLFSLFFFSFGRLSRRKLTCLLNRCSVAATDLEHLYTKYAGLKKRIVSICNLLFFFFSSESLVMTEPAAYFFSTSSSSSSFRFLDLL